MLAVLGTIVGIYLLIGFLFMVFAIFVKGWIYISPHAGAMWTGFLIYAVLYTFLWPFMALSIHKDLKTYKK